MNSCPSAYNDLFSQPPNSLSQPSLDIIVRSEILYRVAQVGPSLSILGSLPQTEVKEFTHV